MAALMAATPVAMAEAGRSIDASTLVVEAHIVAMYLPSLFSGHLVRHFTAPLMLVPGTLLLLLGSALLFISTDNVIFFASLIIIGLGWNFSYVSASSLLLAALKSPLEKPLAQGMFDSLALGGLSVAVVSSGFTFDGIGWRNMYTVRLHLYLQRHAMACHLRDHACHPMCIFRIRTWMTQLHLLYRHRAMQVVPSDSTGTRTYSPALSHIPDVPATHHFLSHIHCSVPDPVR